MANFPPLYLTAAGLPERLVPGDGGLEIVVINAPIAASPVNLFAAVTSVGGSVTMFSSFAGVMNIGAASSTAAFAGGLTAVGTGIFGSTVTVGNASGTPTLSLGGGDVTKYINASQGLANTPAIRYNHVSNRWEYTDDGITYYTFLSAGTTWDGVYSTDKTLDINSTAVAWAQTGSNTGSAFTVSRTLAAGDTNAPLVHFSGSGDFTPLLVTNSSSAYGVDVTLAPAAAGALGVVVRTANHLATNLAFNIYDEILVASVWNVSHAGDMTLRGNRSISTTAAGNLHIAAAVPGYVAIGTGAPTYASANYSLYVQGDLEVDSASYFINSANTFRTASIEVQNASTGNTYLTIEPIIDDGINFLIGYDNNRANRVFVFGDYANTGNGYGHTALHNDPTVYVQSALVAPGGNDAWISRHHNQTNGVDRTGRGGQLLAPFNGQVYFATQSASVEVGTNFYIKTVRSLVTLTATETAVGLTPGGVILGAAFRVSTQITGLSNDAHTLGLGINGTPAKYCTVTHAVATTIDVNTKAQYNGLTLAAETNALVLTIGVGGDTIPTAGAVEVEIHYLFQDAIPNP